LPHQPFRAGPRLLGDSGEDVFGVGHDAHMPLVGNGGEDLVVDAERPHAVMVLLHGFGESECELGDFGQVHWLGRHG